MRNVKPKKDDKPYDWLIKIPLSQCLDMLFRKLPNVVTILITSLSLLTDGLGI